MSDTFFTAAPHWRWLIIFYFFVGGLAGGAYFLGAVLEWFGRPDDRPVIRTAYRVGFWGAVVSGLLLTLDLGRPLRFWHMLFQSANLPHLMFKAWSPISFGAWALLLFGACAFLTTRLLREGTALAKIVAGLGGLLGFFVAGYTGVLLSVTNRPLWADSPWLGALFLASGASTAAALLGLLGPNRGAAQSSLRWLSTFDARALVVELLLLIVFVASLGALARVWVSVWGAVLVVGVVGVGIVWPLVRLARPAAGHAGLNPAVAVLIGGFLLRVVLLLASEGIELHRSVAGVVR
jgi:protein NrfD